MTSGVLSQRAALLPIAVVPLAVAYATARSPLLALAGAGGLVVLALAVLNAGALLLVLVAALPWDDFLAVPTETVSVIKLLGALVLAGYLIRALARNDSVRLPGTLGAVVVFTMLMLVSLLLSGVPAEGVSKALRYLLFAAFFFVLVQIVRSRGEVLAVLRVLSLSATAAAIVGLATFVGGSADRVSGPIGEANDFAYLLASTLPLTVYLVVAERRRRWLWLACSAILGLGLLGTLSRGALVGLAAVAVWGIATRRVHFGGVLAAVGIMAGAVLIALLLWMPLIDERLAAKETVADANVASRKAYWSAAERMAADHPVLGVGPGLFGAVARDRYIRSDPVGLERPVVHNSYLEVLAEGGLPALAAFLLFVAGSWRLASRGRRVAAYSGDAEGARLASAVQASLIVAIVSACFLSVQITAPLWLLGGLAVAVGSGGPGRERALAPA